MKDLFKGIMLGIIGTIIAGFLGSFISDYRKHKRDVKTLLKDGVEKVISPIGGVVVGVRVTKLGKIIMSVYLNEDIVRIPVYIAYSKPKGSVIYTPSSFHVEN